MEAWDLALLVVAGYLAVVSLVRLMAHHRDQVVERFSHQMRKQRTAKRREAASEKPAAGRRQAG
jgi:hypothetical protein